MSLHFGVQLEVTEETGSLRPGVRYYFAGRRPDNAASLVWFYPGNRKNWRVGWLTLEGHDFESLLLEGRLRTMERQLAFPEWLSDVENINFEAREDRRYPGKRASYRQQAEQRLMQIEPALEREDEILASANPLSRLARLARQGGKVQMHRYQVWFFAFVLHGHNLWALKKPTHRCGTWDRKSEKHAGTKFGRHPENTPYCFTASGALLGERCVKSYLSRCGLGISMRSIHRQALIQDFGCQTMDDADGNRVFYHPESEPFPSYGQFRNAVIRTIGQEDVRRTLYGSARMRRTARIEQGNYTAQYANILEAVEVDVFYVAERPKAVLTGKPSPPLAVARGVCAATGAITGVGFSLGAENASAYRAMLFCMAAPKPYVARIYGLDPAHVARWTMVGLPPHVRSDRGPAGGPGLIADADGQIPYRAIAPSYSPQSKPLVEGSHPRSVRVEGAPVHRLSELNVIEMIKRELLRAIADNDSSDISARLDDAAIREFEARRLVATPACYWDYLEKRGRTVAQHMALEQAVRTFWDPVEFDLDRNGVRFRNHSFTSAKFRQSPLMKRLGTKGFRAKVQGYILPITVRYVWVEVDGALLELEAVLRVRGDEHELAIPLSELEAADGDLKSLQSRTRVHAEASKAAAETDCEKATGKSWDKSELKKGPAPQRSRATDTEARIATGRQGKRKAS